MLSQWVHVCDGDGEDVSCHEPVHCYRPGHGVPCRGDCLVMPINAVGIDAQHGNLVTIVDGECDGVGTNGPIILRWYECVLHRHVLL